MLLQNGFGLYEWFKPLHMYREGESLQFMLINRAKLELNC